MSPAKVAIVHNPRSERNRRNLQEVRDVLSAIPQRAELSFSDGVSLEDIAREVASLSPELIVINSGDGTVHGLLTALLRSKQHEFLPPIAILPRGMANMTAYDCGLQGRGLRRLRQLVAAIRANRLADLTVHRQVLRVEGAVGEEAQYGMFMGAGAIDDAVKYCKSRVHGRGLKGEAANLTTLGELLGRVAIGRKPHGMLEGIEVELDVDGERRTGRELLLLVTTLDRLVVGARPFWGKEPGPARITAIGYPTHGLFRHAWNVLYGGKERGLPEPHYFSRGGNRIEMRLDAPFIIDGEHFRASGERPLVITADDTVPFVRL